MEVISVLNAGAGEHALACTIGHIQKLFAKLADEGLVDGHAFCVRDYSEDDMDENAASIRELVVSIFDPNLRMPSSDARAHALLNVTLDPSLSPLNFQDLLKALGQVVDSATVSKILGASESLRDRVNKGEPVNLPQVILLPSDFSSSFGARHGIALWGSFAVLCHCYQQIVWHEVLHLCFQLVDCYDETSMRPTCELSTCIMQWEPSNANLDSGSWLCEGQRTRLREWSKKHE